MDLFTADPDVVTANDLTVCLDKITVVDHDNLALHVLDAATGDVLQTEPIPGDGRGIATFEPCGPIFADGFESGDLTGWSSSSQ